MNAPIISPADKTSMDIERLVNSVLMITKNKRPKQSAAHAVTQNLNTGRRELTAITSPADSMRRLRYSKRAVTENTTAAMM